MLLALVPLAIALGICVVGAKLEDAIRPPSSLRWPRWILYALTFLEFAASALLVSYARGHRLLAVALATPSLLLTLWATSIALMAITGQSL